MGILVSRGGPGRPHGAAGVLTVSPCPARWNQNTEEERDDGAGTSAQRLPRPAAADGRHHRPGTRASEYPHRARWSEAFHPEPGAGVGPEEEAGVSARVDGRALPPDRGTSRIRGCQPG